MPQKVLLIYGPTASGKTSLGIEIAQALNGVIINADSRQLYKHMPVLTAVPTAEEQAAAPHKLYEVLEVEEDCSAPAYVKLAQAEIQAAHAAGKLPILVGGTGFYLDVLQHGLSPIPEVPAEVLSHYKQRVTAEGLPTLREELRKRDPAWAAKTEEADMQRTLRGLTVYEVTGKTLTDWQQEPRQGGLNYDFIRLAIQRPRPEVRERVKLRFDMMLADGLMDELQALKAANYALDLPGMRAMGANVWFQHLVGELSFEDAKELYLIQQYQYSKRQAAWIRHHFKAHVELQNPKDVNMQQLTQMLGKT